jgi:carbon-monoxide dehydrogenase small subunit
MKQIVELAINGQAHEVMVAPRDLLVDVLRKSLGLTGTKVGCGHGHCGTCTVLIDGQPVLACLVLALSCQEKEILTVEGLETNGELGPIQQAFIDYGAVQCGFCIPGMSMSAKALLARNAHPSEDEIRSGLAGVLCRCTGYMKIIEAVQSVAAETPDQ